jgi:hypothetical protein
VAQPQQPPPPLPGPLELASPVPGELEANVENFFASFIEPQCGHFVPCQSLERTRISLSRSHLAQWNS